MIRSIRIILAIAAYYDYEIWQMDVKTAFLNGILEKDVYMTQPEGFEDPDHAGKVCKLKRSIYGLKYLGVGIFVLMKRSKSLILSYVKKILVYIRSLVGVRWFS